MKNVNTRPTTDHVAGDRPAGHGLLALAVAERPRHEPSLAELKAELERELALLEESIRGLFGRER